MTLRYHPILAFGAFYVIGLAMPLVCVAGLGLIAHPAAIWLITSGYINVIPLGFVWLAANKAALADGRPLFRQILGGKVCHDRHTRRCRSVKRRQFRTDI